MIPAETAARPAIVVADDDLLFSARISSALESLGYHPVVVRTLDAFASALAEAPAAAILNLASRQLDAIDAIRRAKAAAAVRGVPLLGFCGHADIPRQTAARTAGCDVVATNGEVAGNLSRLLRMLLTIPQSQTPAREQS
jgi:DNA-binding response OmpR family regulator